MAMSPRNRLIVTIAAAAFVVIALIALLVYPQVRQLALLNSEVGVASAQADVAKSQLEQRSGFKDRAVETNAKWLRLMNQVPDSPDLPSLIIELQDVAFKSGVQLVSVTPAQPAPKDAYVLVPVGVEILGTWSDTVDYMQALVKLDRGIRPMDASAVVLKSGDEIARRNSSLAPYSVRTMINLEAYLIPEVSTPAQ